MSCCIYICPNCFNPCKAVAHVCPSQMGGNPTNQVCLSPEMQAIQQAGGTGTCVCPNLVKPCEQPLGIPGFQNFINAAKNAGRAIEDTASSWFDKFKAMFPSLPKLELYVVLVLAVIFILFLITVFVYAYGKSRV